MDIELSDVDHIPRLLIAQGYPHEVDIVMHEGRRGALLVHRLTGTKDAPVFVPYHVQKRINVYRCPTGWSLVEVCGLPWSYLVKRTSLPRSLNKNSAGYVEVYAYHTAAIPHGTGGKARRAADEAALNEWNRILFNSTANQPMYDKELAFPCLAFYVPRGV